MSNSIWPSDTWGQDESDFYAIDDKHGFLKTVRIRELDDSRRVMFTQLFYPSGTKHSEHVFELRGESQKEAVDIGMGQLEWLIGVSKRL